MTNMQQPQQGMPAAAPKNGMGTTALVLGIIGILLAWIPIIGFFGFILGALAVVFGIIGVVRSHKGTATNMVISYVGLGLGALAFIVSIAVFGAFANEVDKQLNNANAGPSVSSGGSTEAGQGTSGDNSKTGKTKPGEVVYEVTGSQGASSITYGKGSQTSQRTNAGLPWSKTAKASNGIEFYSLTAQTGQAGGKITCKITVNGKVLAENSSEGPYALVSCNGDTAF